ncbi:hypothetical protein [Trueperella pyogenes]|uniref:hypothetical protein n=1 Tax=Trueperella pyogenes TaxID=1661 RepID=UPI001432EE87|nr:hypothetical protein [Trueperella pyogenes]QIU86927.1 hypothetical protein HEP79_06695 [Trueperella pyogenes]
MRLLKYEKDFLLGTVGFLTFVFLLSSAFVTFYPGNDITIFSGKSIGDIYTNAETKTVWESVAGTYVMTVFAAGFLGANYAGVTRTYLGAGMTRMVIFQRLTKVGLLITALFTAMIAALWGIAAAVGMPDLSGVDPINLSLMPLWILFAYAVAMFVTALFIRFTWWKVIAAAIVMQSAVGAVVALLQRAGVRLPAGMALGREGMPVAVFLFAIVWWIGTWALLRKLPVRRH